MGKNLTQQDFLREAMATLGLTREQFADRLGTSKRRLDNWLLPSDSKEFRSMDDMVWNFVREILKNKNRSIVSE